MGTTMGIGRRLSLVIALSVGAACASNPPPGAIYLERRPPPARVEVIGVAPGPGFVWVTGFWRWGGAEYVWVPGRWAAPARGYRQWAPGHWQHARRGWYWVEGRWR